MSDIIVAGSLIPSTPNTTLDKRSMVSTLSDIENIENPAIGMFFYCEETDSFYQVTSLKSKKIGALTVENGAVNTYKQIMAKGEPGVTPVRGVDYWTAADIAAIKAYCDNAILNGEW